MDYPKDLVLPELGTFPSEDELSKYVLDVMSQWFSIETQVEGQYCGQQTLRLDAVLRPLDTTGWTDSDPAFGVEFKLPQPDAGIKDYFKWAAQAVDYTHTDWNGYGRLQIFICPSPVMQFVTTPKQSQEQRKIRRKQELLEFAQERVRNIHAMTARLDPGASPEHLEAHAEYLTEQALQMQRETIAKHQIEDEEAFAEGFQDALDRSEWQRHLTGGAISRLLGQLNVGDLMPVKHHGSINWALLRSGTVLWCEGCGIRGRWSIRPQLGSR